MLLLIATWANALRPCLSAKMLIVTWANFLLRPKKFGLKKKNIKKGKKTKKKVRTINIVRVCGGVAGQTQTRLMPAF